MDSKNRSCSLPIKLNPINHRIENKLRKLRHKEELSTSASETISIGLSGLAELYQCINENLSLPLTRQALSFRQHHKCVSKLLRECSSLLGVSSTTREIVVQLQETMKTLEMSLSQGKEGSIIERNISNYNSSRKEGIRRAKGVILSLKQLSDDSLRSLKILEEDQRLSMVTTALRCVSIINVSVYESLLSYLSKSVVSKRKWSLVLRLVKKGQVGRNNDGSVMTEIYNKLNDIDAVIHTLVSKGKVDELKSQIAVKRLKALVGTMEGFENGLQSLCKQLTQTKASLMDIASF